MSTTEAKLDALIASVSLLNEQYQASQVTFDRCFQKLEGEFSKAQEDIGKAQEEATECAIKRAKRQ